MISAAEYRAIKGVDSAEIEAAIDKAILKSDKMPILVPIQQNWPRSQLEYLLFSYRMIGWCAEVVGGNIVIELVP